MGAIQRQASAPFLFEALALLLLVSYNGMVVETLREDAAEANLELQLTEGLEYAYALSDALGTSNTSNECDRVTLETCSSWCTTWYAECDTERQKCVCAADRCHNYGSGKRCILKGSKKPCRDAKGEEVPGMCPPGRPQKPPERQRCEGMACSVDECCQGKDWLDELTFQVSRGSWNSEGVQWALTSALQLRGGAHVSFVRRLFHDILVARDTYPLGRQQAARRISAGRIALFALQDLLKNGEDLITSLPIVSGCYESEYKTCNLLDVTRRLAIELFNSRHGISYKNDRDIEEYRKRDQWECKDKSITCSFNCWSIIAPYPGNAECKVPKFSRDQQAYCFCNVGYCWNGMSGADALCVAKGSCDMVDCTGHGMKPRPGASECENVECRKRECCIEETPAKELQAQLRDEDPAGESWKLDESSKRGGVERAFELFEERQRGAEKQLDGAVAVLIERLQAEAFSARSLQPKGYDEMDMAKVVGLAIAVMNLLNLDGAAGRINPEQLVELTRRFIAVDLSLGWPSAEF